MHIMELNFNNLLLRTAFSCMACDGEIAPEEVALIKNMAIEKAMFGDINIDEELNFLLAEINSKGKGFLKQYLLYVSEQDLTTEQECSILQVAVDTIQSDEKIEYSEIKFFKVLRSNLKNVTDEQILENVIGIDESYLAEDIKQSYLELFDAYFNNLELKELTIHQ